MPTSDVLSNNGLTNQRYSVNLTSGVPLVLPTGPIPKTQPVFGVVLTSTQNAPGVTVTGYTWTTTGNGAPQLTVTFSSALTLSCTIAVLFKE